MDHSSETSPAKWIFLVWALFGGGLGSLMGYCVWDSLANGDFGGGAWLGGFVAISFVTGLAPGLIQAILEKKQGALASLIGAALGAVGAPLLFLIDVKLLEIPRNLHWFNVHKGELAMTFSVGGAILGTITCWCWAIFIHLVNRAL